MTARYTNVAIVTALVAFASVGCASLAQENSDSVLKHLRSADEAVRHGTFKYETSIFRGAIAVDQAALEKEVAEKGAQLRDSGTPERIVREVGAATRRRENRLAKDERQVRTQTVAYADDGRFALDATTRSADGAVSDHDVWDGTVDYGVEGDTLTLTSAKPYWAQPGGALRYLSPGPSLPMGRGLAALSNPVVLSSAGGIIVDGGAPGGVKVHAEIDPHRGYIVKFVETHTPSGEVMDRWTYGPARKEHGVWLPSWANHAIYPNSPGIATHRFQLVSADFRIPDASVFAPPALHGWARIRDVRLGKQISYRSIPNTIATYPQLLEYTRRQTLLAERQDAKIALLSQAELMKTRIRLVLSFLLIASLATFGWLHHRARQSNLLKAGRI